MAKKQSRRSVSVTRGIFERAKEEAERDGLTLSHWLALLLKAEFDKRGRPFNVNTFHMSRRTMDRRAETNFAQAQR